MKEREREGWRGGQEGGTSDGQRSGENGGGGGKSGGRRRGEVVRDKGGRMNGRAIDRVRGKKAMRGLG